MRSLHISAKSSPLLATTREKPVRCNEDPAQPKINKQKMSGILRIWEALAMLGLHSRTSCHLGRWSQPLVGHSTLFHLVPTHQFWVTGSHTCPHHSLSWPAWSFWVCAFFTPAAGKPRDRDVVDYQDNLSRKGWAFSPSLWEADPGWGGTCPLKVPCAQLCSLGPWTVPLIAGFLHEPSSYFCQNSFHPEMLAQKHSGPRTRRLRLMCAFVIPATEWKVSLVIIKVQEGFLHDMTPHPQLPYWYPHVPNKKVHHQGSEYKTWEPSLQKC